MKSLFTLVWVAILVLARQLEAEDANPFHLKDGDRVVFYGDSITDQRLYTTFTETYAVTRFPKKEITFIHSGWGGDRVSGGGGGKIDVRLKRDVFEYKPTVMTIMLGMNDASYRAFDEKIFAQYTNGYQHIVDSVQSHFPKLRLTLIQPSPFDDVTRPPTFEGGYNTVLVRYGQYVKELAQRENANVADLNTAVVAAVEKANAKNKDLAIKMNPDRVHPAAAGQLLMAAELLKSWKAPATVTAVELDAGAKKVVSAKQTRVWDLSSNGSFTWKQFDESLPMPIDLKDPVIALAVESSGFTEALNQQTLKVTGLNGNRHRLKIDGEEVGTFSREQLEKGINLATLATPMFKQAQEVHRLTLQHNDVHFTRWRQIELKVSPDLPNYGKTLKALDELERDIVKQQRAAAEPKVRRYELTSVD